MWCTNDDSNELVRTCGSTLSRHGHILKGRSDTNEETVWDHAEVLQKVPQAADSTD